MAQLLDTPATPPGIEILSVAAMAAADQVTIDAGTSGYRLMQYAGRAVAMEVARHLQGTTVMTPRVLICCANGNNGGDGLVAALYLHKKGVAVDVLLISAGGFSADAQLAYQTLLDNHLAGILKRAPLPLADTPGTPGTGSVTDATPPAASPRPSQRVSDYVEGCLGQQLDNYTVVVDALYGAGLNRPLHADTASLIQRLNQLPAHRIAVDIPSGLQGDSALSIASPAATASAGAIAVTPTTTVGKAGESATVFAANTTVTFCRRKPVHVLHPGKAFCGNVITHDIGISDTTVAQLADYGTVNHPSCWIGALQPTPASGHKYSNGHVLVLGGNITGGGAARLAATAALRTGAGLLTVACPGSALSVYASQLTCAIPRAVDSIDDVRLLLRDTRINSVLIGPGFGVGTATREWTLAVLETLSPNRHLVLDADALTSFAADPEPLFRAIHATAGGVVMTPHAGEFQRLFGDMTCNGESRDAANGWRNKIAITRLAAARSGACVVYKGDDTVIAAPTHSTTKGGTKRVDTAARTGTAEAAMPESLQQAVMSRVNINGVPWLATAGSGDVLAGSIAALLARGMMPLDAAGAAVWLHADAARQFGPGLIASDIPLQFPDGLRKLFRQTTGETTEPTSV